MRKIFKMLFVFVTLFFVSFSIYALEYTEVDTETELKDALANGENVKLMSDLTTVTTPISITKSLTLNLNGYDLDGTESSNINNTMSVTGSGVVVTIVDNSTNHDGKILSSDNGTGPIVLLIDNGAKVILESGIISTENFTVSGIAVAIKNSSEFVMDGGEIILTPVTNKRMFGVNLY